MDATTPNVDTATADPGILPSPPPLDGGAAAAWPPAGFVDRHGAAAVIGVVPLTLKRFVDEGKVPPGRRVAGSNGRPRVLYAVAV